MMLVVRLSIPLNALRGAMILLSSGGLLVAFLFFGAFFKLVPLSGSALTMLLICGGVTVVLFNVMYQIADHYIEKFKRQPFGAKKK